LASPAKEYHACPTGTERSLPPRGTRRNWGTPRSNNRALTLAAWRSEKQCNPLTGQLERVSIWSRALPAGEVRSLFDARKQAFPDAQPEPPEAVTDWPTYRRDNRRSATTPDPIGLPLALLWVHKPRQAPAPAWPEPAKADFFHRIPKLEPRVIYDRAFHAVTVGDRVLFGSSAEDKVVCLDARSGRTVWQFFTEGPVRLAPAIADGRAVVPDASSGCSCDYPIHALMAPAPAGRSSGLDDSPPAGVTSCNAHRSHTALLTGSRKGLRWRQSHRTYLPPGIQDPGRVLREEYPRHE
jgi:hypothetical protein